MAAYFFSSVSEVVRRCELMPMFVATFCAEEQRVVGEVSSDARASTGVCATRLDANAARIMRERWHTDPTTVLVLDVKVLCGSREHGESAPSARTHPYLPINDVVVSTQLRGKQVNARTADPESDGKIDSIGALLPLSGRNLEAMEDGPMGLIDCLTCPPMPKAMLGYLASNDDDDDHDDDGGGGGGGNGDKQQDGVPNHRPALQALRRPVLRERALRAGADAKLLDEVDEQEKSVLVDLVLRLELASKEQELQSSLQRLKLRELRERAERAGADTAAIDEADEADEAKTAFVKLVLELELRSIRSATPASPLK